MTRSDNSMKSPAQAMALELLRHLIGYGDSADLEETINLLAPTLDGPQARALSENLRRAGLLRPLSMLLPALDADEASHLAGWIVKRLYAAARRPGDLDAVPLARCIPWLSEADLLLGWDLTVAAAQRDALPGRRYLRALGAFSEALARASLRDLLVATIMTLHHPDDRAAAVHGACLGAGKAWGSVMLDQIPLPRPQRIEVLAALSIADVWDMRAFFAEEAWKEWERLALDHPARARAAPVAIRARMRADGDTMVIIAPQLIALVPTMGYTRGAILAAHALAETIRARLDRPMARDALTYLARHVATCPTPADALAGACLIPEGAGDPDIQMRLRRHIQRAGGATPALALIGSQLHAWSVTPPALPGWTQALLAQAFTRSLPIQGARNSARLLPALALTATFDSAVEAGQRIIASAPLEARDHARLACAESMARMAVFDPSTRPLCVAAALTFLTSPPTSELSSDILTRLCMEDLGLRARAAALLASLHASAVSGNPAEAMHARRTPGASMDISTHLAIRSYTARCGSWAWGQRAGQTLLDVRDAITGNLVTAHLRVSDAAFAALRDAYPLAGRRVLFAAARSPTAPRLLGIHRVTPYGEAPAPRALHDEAARAVGVITVEWLQGTQWMAEPTPALWIGADRIALEGFPAIPLTDQEPPDDYLYGTVGLHHLRVHRSTARDFQRRARHAPARRFQELLHASGRLIAYDALRLITGHAALNNAERQRLIQALLESGHPQDPSIRQRIISIGARIALDAGAASDALAIIRAGCANPEHLTLEQILALLAIFRQWLAESGSSRAARLLARAIRGLNRPWGSTPSLPPPPFVTLLVHEPAPLAPHHRQRWEIRLAQTYGLDLHYRITRTGTHRVLTTAAPWSALRRLIRGLMALHLAAHIAAGALTPRSIAGARPRLTYAWKPRLRSGRSSIGWNARPRRRVRREHHRIRSHIRGDQDPQRPPLAPGNQKGVR